MLDALKYWGKPVLLAGLSIGWLALGAICALAAMYATWKVKRGNPLETPPSTGSPRIRGQSTLRTVWLGAPLAAVPLIAGGLVVSPIADKGVLGWDLESGSVRFTVALLISGVVFAYAVGMLSPKPSAYVQNDSAVPLRKTLFSRRDFVRL